jgi:hypothetical protein
MRLGERTPGRLTPEEHAASQILCTIAPTWGLPVISDIVERKLVGTYHLQVCEGARWHLSFDRAVERQGPEAAMLEWGVVYEPDGFYGGYLRGELTNLLAQQEELRLHAGPLLDLANAKRLRSYEYLRSRLCSGEVPVQLVETCARNPSGQERAWGQGDRRLRLGIALGIGTALAGGHGLLAYYMRDNDGGRALGVTTSATLAAGLTAYLASRYVARTCSGALCGLHMFWIAPLSVLGGVAGGWAGSLAAKEPGTARVLTTVVPLTLAWGVGVGLVVGEWGF